MTRATKQDLIDSLTKQGVELTRDETVAELEALVEATASRVKESDSTDDSNSKVYANNSELVNLYSSADNDEYGERATSRR